MGDVRQDSSIQIHVWDSPSDYIEWTGSLDAVVRQTLSMQERQAAAADADAMACLSPEADCAELLLRGAIEVVHQSDPRGINQWRVDVLTCALQLHTTETTTADVDKMYPEPIPGLDRKDCNAVVTYFCQKHLQEFGGVGCKAKEDWLRANTTYSFSENTIRNKAGTVHKAAQKRARNERERMATPDDCEPSLSIQEGKRHKFMTQEEDAAESPESRKLIRKANKLLKDNK